MGADTGAMLRKFLKGNREPTPAEPPAKPARSPATKAGQASSNLGAAIKPDPGEKQPSYDPYNSGAFDKRGAWSKVTRKN